MKKAILIPIFCFVTCVVFAQTKTYDLIRYAVPDGWEKEEKENLIAFIKRDNKKQTWCQMYILKSTASKGDIEADLQSEWKELAVKNYKLANAAEFSAVEEYDGWKMKTGSEKFIFNDVESVVVLTTFSGYGRCVSIVTATNTGDYSADITKFWKSIELVKPEQNTTPLHTNNAPLVNSSFAFNTTNFDDGWTSTVQEDWVEVRKGGIKVLLHYPQAGTIFPADPDVLTNAAWNILTAPRYSNLVNYKTKSITTYNRPYLGMGYATENASGKTVFIVLFRQGQTGWLEFVSPDKASFIQQFKFDPEAIQWDSESDLMIPLINMTGYNKFAIAASDFSGKWTSDFTGIQQMYHVYTGQYAGMNINQSNEEFVFDKNGDYKWKLLVINGMVGNTKYTEVKSDGRFTIINNWQIQFSKIESGPRTFHAYWSCIKGARVLNLLDANAPGSGIYTQYGLAK